MKIEKLNEDKIRIILDVKDLQEKNIDYQAFMSNSIESQKIFLDMLDQAEEEVGFITQDYKIMIEALASSDGTFILTITRISPEETRKKKVSIKRRNSQITEKQAIYEFTCFDDFCQFCKFLDSRILHQIQKLSKHFSLYLYQDTYYLVIDEINLDFPYLKAFYSNIIEFGKFVSNPDLFKRKLQEYGTVIMKQRAVQTCIKHFVTEKI